MCCDAVALLLFSGQLARGARNPMFSTLTLNPDELWHVWHVRSMLCLVVSYNLYGSMNDTQNGY